MYGAYCVLGLSVSGVLGYSVEYWKELIEIAVAIAETWGGFVDQVINIALKRVSWLLNLVLIE